MPKQSLNPILATGSSANVFEPIELEIFIEKLTPLDSYTSLGVFTFAANTSEAIEEQIQSILNAAIMADIQKMVPPSEVEPFIVKEFSRKFKYRTRFFGEDLEWSGWTDSTPDFILYGGQAYEEFANGFSASATSGPTILKIGSPFFASYSGSYVFVLAQAIGDLTFEFQFFNHDGTSSTTSGGTFAVSRAFSVVGIPVAYPPANKSPLLIFSVTVDSVTRTAQMVCDLENRAHAYNLAYLSAGGAWAFLPCHGAMSKVIEVSQQAAERSLPNNYHELANKSQYRVWDSKGSRRFALATGYWPEAYLAPVIQDFLLSPIRLIWDTGLSKWVPVLINTKTATYHEDFQNNLRSFVFEARLAFDSNIPKP